MRAPPTKLVDVPEPAAAPRDRLAPDRAASPSVYELARSWRGALDTAESALQAGRDSLGSADVSRRGQLLGAERASTLKLLVALAHERGHSGRFLHLVPRRQLRTLLDLPSSITACVFELDGVLVASAELHVAAWQQTFDELILRRAEATQLHIPPFHPRTDYGEHIHGKPRLAGVVAFLESRGISLPLGTPDDPPGSETVHGLANRKNDVLVHLIDVRGVHSYDDSKHYVETAVEAGLRTAVVSASANTDTILARTGLSELIDGRVDGRAMVAEHLRKRPAPDVLLAACRLLDVEPNHAAAFETTPGGVEAARAAGITEIVAVDRAGRADGLRAAGAHIVTPDLGALLERRVAA